MRKIIALEHISLDGVLQAPGGPEEDPGGGFAHGGWIRSFSGEILAALLRSQQHILKLAGEL